MSDPTLPHRLVIVQRDPVVGRAVDDRFEVVEPIARGTSGRVYRAIDRTDGSSVALKVLDGTGGEFDEAADAMQHAHETARHYEGLVASLDWVYMSLRRLGRDADAAKVLDRFQEVVDDADLTGLGYADRLHLYSGDLDPDGLRQRVTENRLVAATIGYGLGNWYLYNGDEETARSVFADVVATGATAAFGYIAAEIDLAATVA